jgi:hypothetical protein
MPGLPPVPSPHVTIGLLNPSADVLAVHSGDEKCQVEGLTAVEPGIAGGLITVAQVAFCDMLPAAYAFRDVVAGELDMDATRMGAERAVQPRRSR